MSTEKHMEMSSAQDLLPFLCDFIEWLVAERKKIEPRPLYETNSAALMGINHTIVNNCAFIIEGTVISTIEHVYLGAAFANKVYGRKGANADKVLNDIHKKNSVAGMRYVIGKYLEMKIEDVFGNSFGDIELLFLLRGKLAHPRVISSTGTIQWSNPVRSRHKTSSFYKDILQGLVQRGLLPKSYQENGLVVGNHAPVYQHMLNSYVADWALGVLPLAIKSFFDSVPNNMKVFCSNLLFTKFGLAKK